MEILRGDWCWLLFDGNINDCLFLGAARSGFPK